ncbi:Protein PBDC1 [Neolecta irregularis DAH-3]|uniref:Protein PBDC1 n=1 Tax=Neolecta irregularis (strain DAH-3) TaxID=1198029 RepID=A0A1U7LWD0_NEOID|nr:Protein PBDC1 [Neolecta irregularis DAH-3]|eukprot:OLL26985.1 Protein PBDC1 [Neolecta irregularis DAH-3]
MQSTEVQTSRGQQATETKKLSPKFIITIQKLKSRQQAATSAITTYGHAFNLKRSTICAKRPASLPLGLSNASFLQPSLEGNIEESQSFSKMFEDISFLFGSAPRFKHRKHFRSYPEELSDLSEHHTTLVLDDELRDTLAEPKGRTKSLDARKQQFRSQHQLQDPDTGCEDDAFNRPFSTPKQGKVIYTPTFGVSGTSLEISSSPIPLKKCMISTEISEEAPEDASRIASAGSATKFGAFTRGAATYSNVMGGLLVVARKESDSESESDEPLFALSSCIITPTSSVRAYRTSEWVLGSQDNHSETCSRSVASRKIFETDASTSSRLQDQDVEPMHRFETLTAQEHSDEPLAVVMKSHDIRQVDTANWLLQTLSFTDCDFDLTCPKALVDIHQGEAVKDSTTKIDSQITAAQVYHRLEDIGYADTSIDNIVQSFNEELKILDAPYEQMSLSSARPSLNMGGSSWLPIELSAGAKELCRLRENRNTTEPIFHRFFSPFFRISQSLSQAFKKVNFPKDWSFSRSPYLHSEGKQPIRKMQVRMNFEKDIKSMDTIYEEKADIPTPDTMIQPPNNPVAVPENAENDETIEQAFAIKAAQHAEVYWNVLSMRKGSELALTNIDAEILEELKKAFPDFKPAETIDEDKMKSPDGKKFWREFMLLFQEKIEDFNFGTLLRSSPKAEYSPETTIFVPRMQFLAIEIWRNYEGLNDWIYEQAQASKNG